MVNNEDSYKWRSTTSALIAVVESWQQVLESGSDICSVLLDAFDKLGTPQSAKWINSQLWTSTLASSEILLYMGLLIKYRSHYGESLWTACVISVHVVPQGSALDPLLYIFNLWLMMLLTSLCQMDHRVYMQMTYFSIIKHDQLSQMLMF